MAQPARYREIVVTGTPRQLGRQIGEAAGAEIRGFCEVALARVNKTIRVSRAAAMQLAAESIPYAERYDADMVDELRGTAEAAGVTLEDLMLLQVRNQLQPEQDAGCTSLSVTADVPGRDPATRVSSNNIVAQNWDNDPALDEFTVVLTRRPVGQPAFTTLTQAGLIAYIGFNEAGIGLCLNSLPAPSRRLGVPHYFTVRGIYQAESLDGAVAAVRRAERAIPANIMLATPQGPADLEITVDDVHVLRHEAAGGVVHTNHCRHPALMPINEQFPELIQSHARQRRIEELIDVRPGRSNDVGVVQAALRDHRDNPRSICRHANDDPATGYWETVFSVIIEPQQRRMHVSRGTPCDREYEVYEMR